MFICQIIQARRRRIRKEALRRYRERDRLKHEIELLNLKKELLLMKKDLLLKEIHIYKAQLGVILCPSN